MAILSNEVIMGCEGLEELLGSRACKGREQAHSYRHSWSWDTAMSCYHHLS